MGRPSITRALDRGSILLACSSIVARALACLGTPKAEEADDDLRAFLLCRRAVGISSLVFSSGGEPATRPSVPRLRSSNAEYGVSQARRNSMSRRATRAFDISSFHPHSSSQSFFQRCSKVLRAMPSSVAASDRRDHESWLHDALELSLHQLAHAVRRQWLEHPRIPLRVPPSSPAAGLRSWSLASA